MLVLLHVERAFVHLSVCRLQEVEVLCHVGPQDQLDDERPHALVLGWRERREYVVLGL